MTRTTRETDDCPEDLLPTRKSLLGRLKNWQDQESWQDFFNTYWKLIYNFAVQRGLMHQEAEEVVQETVLAVARNISSFRYDPAKCSFKTYLLVITNSKITDQLRRRQRQVVTVSADEGSRSTPRLERVPDRSLDDRWQDAWDTEWKKNLMDAAIQRVKRKVAPGHFQIFDLLVLKAWPAGDVAKTLGISMASVYVAKHRVGKMVKREVSLLEEKSA